MIALLLFAQLAATPTPSAAPKPAPSKAPGSDEMVCRSDTATGHRISARTCRTRAEWKLQEDAANRLMDHRYTTYGQGNTCTPGQNC